MSRAAWLVIGIAVLLLPVGWPANELARRPGGRGGLGWLALTFVLPAIVWVVVAAVGGSDYDAGDLVYVVGYGASVAAILVGTIVSRTAHNRRS